MPRAAQPATRFRSVCVGDAIVVAPCELIEPHNGAAASDTPSVGACVAIKEVITNGVVLKVQLVQTPVVVRLRPGIISVISYAQPRGVADIGKAHAGSRTGGNGDVIHDAVDIIEAYHPRAAVPLAGLIPSAVKLKIVYPHLRTAA